jgi:hypothetical protein
MEIILAQGTAPASKAIAYLTKKIWSHCALRYSSPEDSWVVHATVGGVQPDWWFYFKHKYTNHLRYKTNVECADQALDNVVNRLAHAQYDYEGFLGQGLAIVFGLKRNPLGSNRDYRCTELITAWIDEVKKLDPSIDLPHVDSELATPGGLADYCDMHSKYFEKVI